MLPHESLRASRQTDAPPPQTKDSPRLRPGRRYQSIAPHSLIIRRVLPAIICCFCCYCCRSFAYLTCHTTPYLFSTLIDFLPMKITYLFLPEINRTYLLAFITSQTLDYCWHCDAPASPDHSTARTVRQQPTPFASIASLGVAGLSVSITPYPRAGERSWGGSGRFAQTEPTPRHCNPL